jgi:hypothetical protein
LQFQPILKLGDQPRVEHAAALIDRGCADARAILRQNHPEIRELCARPVTL